MYTLSVIIAPTKISNIMECFLRSFYTQSLPPLFPIPFTSAPTKKSLLHFCHTPRTPLSQSSFSQLVSEIYSCCFMCHWFIFIAK